MARATKKTVRLTVSALSKRLEGRVVAGLEGSATGSLEIHFSDGDYLAIEQVESGVGLMLHEKADSPEGRALRPTRRQLEYLDFIRKYLHRNGLSPAETDIQEYFSVSAPSVNQMIRTLERRGFISRDRDWSGKTMPRSIRVLWDG